MMMRLVFLEVVCFHLDCYENGEIDVEYVREFINTTDVEGYIEPQALNTDDMNGCPDIDKLHSDNYYQILITTTNNAIE